MGQASFATSFRSSSVVRLNWSFLSKGSDADWRFPPTGSTETGTQLESLECWGQRKQFHALCNRQSIIIEDVVLAQKLVPCPRAPWVARFQSRQLHFTHSRDGSLK